MKKDYSSWSSEDLKKVFGASPWAKDVTISTNAPGLSDNTSGDPGSSGSGGGRRNGGGGGGEPSLGGGGAGGAGGAGGGGRGDGGSAGGAGPIQLVVSWRSALPLKEAVVKARVGAAEVPADAKAFLDKNEEQYVVMIEGMPNRFAQAAQQDDKKLKESVLKVGKREIHLANATFSRKGTKTDILLMFPRTDAIKVDDNEVEVVARLGQLDVKKKFKLKEMIFNGKLEL